MRLSLLVVKLSSCHLDEFVLSVFFSFSNLVLYFLYSEAQYNFSFRFAKCIHNVKTVDSSRIWHFWNGTGFENSWIIPNLLILINWYQPKSLKIIQDWPRSTQINKDQTRSTKNKINQKQDQPKTRLIKDACDMCPVSFIFSSYKSKQACCTG